MPHWQQNEVMQFVTFRLKDAMPMRRVREWREERALWLKQHPRPWDPTTEREYYRKFEDRLERWLDEGLGSCLLRGPECRLRLEEVLMTDHEDRAIHEAWVIMPNHVHLLFTPEAPLEQLMKSWKGISAHRIGQGSIWQKNYRDTLIRDADHFVNAVRYIRRNPVTLPPADFTLWQGPRARAIP